MRVNINVCAKEKLWVRAISIVDAELVKIPIKEAKIQEKIDPYICKIRAVTENKHFSCKVFSMLAMFLL